MSIVAVGIVKQKKEPRKRRFRDSFDFAGTVDEFVRQHLRMDKI